MDVTIQQLGIPRFHISSWIPQPPSWFTGNWRGAACILDNVGQRPGDLHPTSLSLIMMPSSISLLRLGYHNLVILLFKFAA